MAQASVQINLSIDRLISPGIFVKMADSIEYDQAREAHTRALGATNQALGAELDRMGAKLAAIREWAEGLSQELPATAVGSPGADTYKNGYGWAQFAVCELLEQSDCNHYRSVTLKDGVTTCTDCRAVVSSK